MEIDAIYKFIITTFALAYFVGLIIGLLIIGLGNTNQQETDITKSFYLTSSISFKNLFNETLETNTKILLFPFSYLIIGVKYGFSHAIYLLSPFLGQIKLVVLLVPEIFYFIAFIFSATIGLKIIAGIIIFSLNTWILKKKKKIKVTVFNRKDSLMFYLAILGIALGTAIQIYLSKTFFIFLINFQLITYILIVLIYIIIISTSLLTLYNIIKNLKKIEWI